MTGPSVATQPPPGWIDATATIAQPPIGGGSGATFTQWTAWRSPTTSDTLLLGCVATPIPGWVDDMRPSVDARTLSLMNASVQRVVGVPVETREADGHLSLRAVGAPESAPHVGIGRTFVGWGTSEVVTCFAACAAAPPTATARSEASAPRPCDPPVRAALLEGTLPPPPPGLVLGAVTWAVHHPATAVTWGAALAFGLGVFVVASRRRPRSRI